MARVEQGVLSRELRRVSSGTATADDLIERALTSPRHMAELRRAMGRADHPDLARTALARVSVQRLLSKPDPLAFIEQNRKGFQQLARMLAPGDPERMMRVLEAMQRTRLVGPPKALPPPAQPGVAQAEGALNMGLNQLSSRIFAVQSGRTSARYVATDVLGRIMRGYSQRQANRLLMQAMLDPNVGRQVVQASHAKHTPERAKQLRLFLISAGIGPDQDNSRQDAEFARSMVNPDGSLSQQGIEAARAAGVDPRRIEREIRAAMSGQTAQRPAPAPAAASQYEAPRNRLLDVTGAR